MKPFYKILNFKKLDLEIPNSKLMRNKTYIQDKLLRNKIQPKAIYIGY